MGGWDRLPDDPPKRRDGLRVSGRGAGPSPRTGSVAHAAAHPRPWPIARAVHPAPAPGVRARTASRGSRVAFEKISARAYSSCIAQRLGWRGEG
jgi:hypothetical protein